MNDTRLNLSDFIMGYLCKVLARNWFMLLQKEKMERFGDIESPDMPVSSPIDTQAFQGVCSLSRWPLSIRSDHS